MMTASTVANDGSDVGHRDRRGLGVGPAIVVGDSDGDRVGIACRPGRVFIEILVRTGEPALARGQVKGVAAAVAPIDRHGVDVDQARVGESAREGGGSAFVDRGRIGLQIRDGGSRGTDADRVRGIGIADVAGLIADRAEEKIVAECDAGEIADARLGYGSRTGLLQRSVPTDR